MAGGLAALLDDVAALVRTTAASLDDVALAAGKASAKTLGVVVDDTAVTPRYVAGLAPARELPIIAKIALGSLRNKLLIILPAILLLSIFAPWALTPILMIGGSYLVFEAAEKILEAVGVLPKHAEESATKDEKTTISSAVRTDFILSAEIMVISLNEVTNEPLLNRALILIAIAIAMTALVYGVVALIVKMDDVGLALAQRPGAAVKALGRGLVKAMPVIMQVLSVVGIAAMLWVGGHILLLGLDELGFTAPYDFVHQLEVLFEEAAGPAGTALAWVVNTFFSAVLGLIVGSVITLIVVGVKRLLPRKASATQPEGTSQHD